MGRQVRKKISTKSTGRNKHTRFLIRHAEGAMPLPPPHDGGSALSRALREACEGDEKQGVWEVIEYEDVIYRVHKLDSPKLDVRVEIVR